MNSDPRFTPTSWTMIAQAGDSQSPEYEEALRTLCNRYWYPLYAFCRRQFSKSPQEAEDLTQAFFSRLIEKSIVAKADADRGKFRTFLLTCFKRFVLNDLSRPRLRCISIDQSKAEARLGLEPTQSSRSPDECFMRDWALQVLQLAQDSLLESYSRRNRLSWFEALKPYLQGKPAVGAYDDISRKLDASVDAVKAEVSRMRKRYQEIIRQQISETVDENTSIDEELRDLFDALST